MGSSFPSPIRSVLMTAATIVAGALLVLPGAVLAGDAPAILVWQPSEVAVDSGPGLLADLTALGEDAALSSNLFAYSSDLSAHEIVVAAVGIFPDTHILSPTEGAALDAYVQAGGRLLLEGGDCFNEDPDLFGGYDVRPMFGLTDGDHGGGFSGDLVGVNLLQAFRFDFDYLGEAFHVDVLSPVTSMSILQHETSGKTFGVWLPAYGAGSTIGVTLAYTGLHDLPGRIGAPLDGSGDGTSGIVARGTNPLRQELLSAFLNLLRGAHPSIDVSPGSFTFEVPLLDTVVEPLSITNTGTGPLEVDLTIDYLGLPTEDAFTNIDHVEENDHVFFGNVYEVDETVPLLEIRQYLDPEWATRVEYVVYESETPTGTFERIFSTTRTAGANEAFHASGPINVTLRAGMVYLIGTSWQDQTEIFDDAGATALPAPVSFGSVISAATADGWPAPATATVTGVDAHIYAQTLVTGEPATLTLLSPSNDSVPAGETAEIPIRAEGGTLPGVYAAELTLIHDDPDVDPIVIPIQIIVSDGVLDATGAATPATFALHPASPNPFRTGTAIAYELAGDAHVRLDLFDVTGRHVRTLREGFFDEGLHTATWDGRDAAGRRVSAGVYYATLETDGTSVRRPVVRLE